MNSALHYFFLGGALNNLLELEHLSLLEYVKLLLALIKEYETFTGATDSTPKNKIAGVGRRLFRSRIKSNDNTNDPSSMMANSSSSTNSSMNTNNNNNSTNNNNNNSNSKSRLSSFGSSHLHQHTANGNNHGNSGSSNANNIQLHNLSSQFQDFQHLKIYHLPFLPDVYETFVSLCETLIIAFKYIGTLLEAAPSATIQESYDLLCKVDDKLRKYVITPTVKDIDTLSRSLIYEETTKLDGLLIQAK